MAIIIDIPNIGKVEVNGAAQEDTMQKILEAVRKSEKTKRSEEAAKAAQDKKDLDAQKKNTKATQDETAAIEERIKESKKEQDAMIVAHGKVKRAMAEIYDKIPASVKEFAAGIGDMAGASMDAFAHFLKNYDKMAEAPVQAGAEILQLVVDMTAQMAKVTVKITSALGQTVLGWIPMVGDGLAAIVQAFEGVAMDVIDFGQTIATYINEVLRDEFQKRIDALNEYASVFVSLSGGMADVASLAAGAGLGIKTFAAAVKDAQPYFKEIGMAGGDAAKFLSKSMRALATTTGASGRSFRDELLAMGHSFEQQGGLVAQYSAQLKSLGVNLAQVAPASLARGTAEYAKHLRVLSDLTGQDAAKLMEQARAESQRGALMEKLSANQARAFQDSFAIFSTLPEQQGAKLQSALAQLLAGGVVTDPIIAGNAIIMDMLQKTANQVSQGNVNMVNATQANLANAAIDYRKAGESVTDFAALMAPGSTSSVATGMAQFGNALRQYRADPGIAKASLEQAESMAQASGEMVAITNAMTAFQVQMEGVTGSALPMYTKTMLWATKQTLDVTTDGINFLKNLYEAAGDSMKTLGAFTTLIADLMNAPPAGTGLGESKAEAFLPGLGRLMGLGTDPSEAIDADESGTGQKGEGSITNDDSWFFDKGGIAKAPVSGHAAVLHGTEAVVPLPDGKTIPVEVSAPPMQPVDNTAINNLTSAVREQNTMMTQMVTLMQKNNSLTSGILQHSM